MTKWYLACSCTARRCRVASRWHASLPVACPVAASFLLGVGCPVHTTACSLHLSALWGCFGFSRLIPQSCFEKWHLPHMSVLSWVEKQSLTEYPGSELLFTQCIVNIFCQRKLFSSGLSLKNKKQKQNKTKKRTWVLINLFLGRILFILESDDCDRECESLWPLYTEWARAEGCVD
jgi:hypothetical protein